VLDNIVYGTKYTVVIVLDGKLYLSEYSGHTHADTDRYTHTHATRMHARMHVHTQDKHSLHYFKPKVE